VAIRAVKPSASSGSELRVKVIVRSGQISERAGISKPYWEQYVVTRMILSESYISEKYPVYFALSMLKLFFYLIADSVSGPHAWRPSARNVVVLGVVATLRTNIAGAISVVKERSHRG